MTLRMLIRAHECHDYLISAFAIRILLIVNNLTINQRNIGYFTHKLQCKYRNFF